MNVCNEQEDMEYTETPTLELPMVEDTTPVPQDNIDNIDNIVTPYSMPTDLTTTAAPLYSMPMDLTTGSPVSTTGFPVSTTGAPVSTTGFPDTTTFAPNPMSGSSGGAPLYTTTPDSTTTLATTTPDSTFAPGLSPTPYTAGSSLNPYDLIPQKMSEDIYVDLKPDPNLDQQFLQNRWSLGIDVSKPKRGFINDLRGAPANPTPLSVISPFQQPTQFPDLYRKSLCEIS